MYGMLRWPNILSVEYRRIGPSNQVEALAGCTLYTGPFVKDLSTRGSINGK